MGRRTIAAPGVRQRQRLLESAVGVLGGRRLEKAVGDPVIHGFEPRSGGITEPGELHRRRLAGKNEQAIAGGAQRKIDEQVNAIFPDSGRQRVIGERADLAPQVGAVPEALSSLIDNGISRIEHDLENCSVVRFENREEGPANHVIAKIRGDVSQAQRPLRIGRVTMHRPGAAQVGGMALVPRPQLGGQFRGTDAGRIEQGMHEIAANDGILRLEFHGVAIPGQRLLDRARVLERIGEIAVRFGKGGCEFDGSAKGRGRLVNLPLVEEVHADVVVSDSEVRLKSDRSAIRDQCVDRGALRREGPAEIVISVGEIRLQFEGTAEGGHRFFETGPRK